MKRSGVVVSQAIAGLSMNRARAVTATVGLAAGSAVLVAGWHAGSLGSGGRWAGAWLLAIVAAATATAPDPRQLRAAAVLQLVGATRRQRRAIVVVEALLLGLLAFPSGWAVGYALATASGTKMPDIATVGWYTVLIPAGVALFAGMTRTSVTVIDARGVSPSLTKPGLRRGRLLRRVALGVALIVGSTVAVSSSKTWFDLDASLWPGIVLSAVGLALLVPLIVDGVAAAFDRMPSITANVSGGLLRARRRLVTPALLLGAIAAFTVAVHAMLGAGLAEREQLRRRDIADRYEFTAGLHPEELIVSGTGGLDIPVLWGSVHVDYSLSQLAEDAAEQARRALPDASVVARVDVLAASVDGDPAVPRPEGRSVVRGTRELLVALGLERFGADLEAGRALALDPSAVIDGKVSIVGFPQPTQVDQGNASMVVVGSTTTTDREVWKELAAVAVDPGLVPLHLPAVLLPPELDVSGIDSRLPTGSLGPDALIVRLPRQATDVDVAALRAATALGTSGNDLFRVEAWIGDEALPDPFDDGRLDASSSVGLRRPGEVRVAIGLVALVAVLGLLVTLRLAAVTRRADEEVIELVGARPAMLRRLAAYQASVLTAFATSLGLGVGILATRYGVMRYNTSGRIGGGSGGTDLPAIPVIVPPVVLAALVVVPLAAAAIAWLLAWRRPRLTPTAIADGLLW